MGRRRPSQAPMAAASAASTMAPPMMKKKKEKGGASIFHKSKTICTERGRREGRLPLGVEKRRGFLLGFRAQPPGDHLQSRLRRRRRRWHEQGRRRGSSGTGCYWA